MPSRRAASRRAAAPHLRESVVGRPPGWAPPQVELYSHVSVFRTLVDKLKSWGWKCVRQPHPGWACNGLGTHPARGCGCPLARRRRGHRDGCGSVCAVYLLDAQFVTDVPKYIAGSMACLSAMMQLELPHVNVLTKVDMLKDSDVNFEKCARSVQRREHRCLRAR